MKRKKRVRRVGRVARLSASEGVPGGVERSGGRRDWQAWRNEVAELKRWLRVPKKRVTVNLDADVLAWLRGQGRGYQREINRLLRRVMEEEMRTSRREQ